MDDQEQDVLVLVQAQEARAPERATGQVEGLLRLGLHQALDLGVALVRGDGAQVDHRQSGRAPVARSPVAACRPR